MSLSRYEEIFYYRGVGRTSPPWKVANVTSFMQTNVLIVSLDTRL